ncbi:hypothetical protein [Carboxydothermus pertinax]|uniref:Uncharacterized protein n=1 Tax=Carboxydothermus pertinax TaxID=870242 RepID=A0A1L8CWF0_9THEO|nr:hypothetical protein [Carboxydothermus pertinax]GAV23179.1 hypothetical protein cpu_16890 [Carboxydothermus pertinax]
MGRNIKKKFIKFIDIVPLLIVAVSSMIGIISGLRTSSHKISVTGLWDALINIGLIKKPDTENIWLTVTIPNLLLSLKVGFLGLISGGLFTFPYLLSWWSLWVSIIKINSINKSFFVIPESIGVTTVVISLIYMGLNYLIYKKWPRYQIILFFLGVLLILIGGIIEQHEISSFVK